MTQRGVLARGRTAGEDLAGTPTRSRRTLPPRGRWGRGRVSPARRRQARNLVFLAPAAVFLAAITGYPLFILVRMSVSHVEAANFLKSWPSVGLGNFTKLFRTDVFVHAVSITAEFVVAVLVATLVLGLLIALVLKAESRLTRFTQAMLVMVWMTPPVVIGSLWKFLAASDGALNVGLVRLHLLSKPVPVFAEPRLALWGIAAVTLWMSLPFAAIVIKAALLDVPRDMLEASRVDGAGAFRQLWYVVLPTIRPTLLIVGVLTIVYALKAFEFIYVLTQGGPGNASTTLPYLGYVYAFENFDFGLAAAVAVICIAFTAVLAVFYARTIRREEAAQ